MKKIFLILLLFAGLSSAQVDCRFHESYIIQFSDSTIWQDPYSFIEGSSANINSIDTLAYGYKCRKQDAKFERTFLDSNVFLERRRDRKEYVLTIYPLNIATHGVAEVFRDEFLRWQQCGMLKLTYEEADSLIAPLVSALNHWHDENIGNNQPYRTSWGLIYEDYVTPIEIVEWVKNSCASSPIAKPVRSVQANIVLENGFARIHKELQGEKYFIFDMNGNVIQEGIAGASIQLPTRQTKVPAVLSIKKRKLLLSISQ